MLSIISHQGKAKQNHFTPTKMAKIQKSNNNTCWQGCGGTRTRVLCHRERNMVAATEK